MPANRTKSGKFAKGSSGNPSGRPRRTDAEKALLEELYQLAPQAADAIRQIITDESTPANVRLRAAEIVLERVAGRPMTIDKIKDDEDTPRFDFNSIFE